MPKQSKIIYEPQMFDLQNYGGISRYFANLIEGVNKTKEFKAELPLVYSTNYYVRNFPHLLVSWIAKIILKKKRKRNNWNLSYANHKISKNNFGLLHATYYNPYFLENLKKPLVITVHDMIHENFSHLFKDVEETINQKKIMIESADLIIAISMYTRQEILRHYPHLADKIKVVYHGLPENILTAANEILPKRFLLYVGDRFAQYKNFEPLINAISPIITHEKELYLICAGGGEFNNDEIELFRKNGILEYVKQTDATDSQLIQFYQDALMFLYPSLEEGFGLPILEAFKNGCAIACSNSSCLPEIGGDAVSYFDPKDINSIHQTVFMLINDAALRLQLINNGHERIKDFTFQKCLDQTIDCYKLLIKDEY
ncbi:glycosyltransferase family 1 protein [Pedobacter sp. UYP1]|uniref:glycosyltransferase family 4 protein n=1 Tax=Pedobacter sp. UYP1 TaxID=1756396 RepID=UPI003393B34D